MDTKILLIVMIILLSGCSTMHGNVTINRNGASGYIGVSL